MRLQGKTAIVTGGGSGFGEGIARTFAREGANVVVNDLNGPAAERVASEIALAGGRAIAVAGDVTRRDDWQTLFAAAIEDFGSVQVVVNNAGTTHRNKPVLEVCRAVLPFLAVLLVGVLLITYLPWLTAVLRAG